MQNVVVLIHSPLVGPLTWSPVANALRERRVETVVPALDDDDVGGTPFWRQHADAVIRAVAPIPREVPLVLVGHSGAGALLPTVGQGCGHPITAYVFVDAGIHDDGNSRLDQMALEDPGFARQFRACLDGGERFPIWTEDDLVSVLPDPLRRRQLVAELRPRALPFFAEPIPVFTGWPDAACAYLKFSAAYDVPARRAREAGWRYRKIVAGHFHMLVDPIVGADRRVCPLKVNTLSIFETRSACPPSYVRADQEGGHAERVKLRGRRPVSRGQTRRSAPTQRTNAPMTRGDWRGSPRCRGRPPCLPGHMTAASDSETRSGGPPLHLTFDPVQWQHIGTCVVIRWIKTATLSRGVPPRGL